MKITSSNYFFFEIKYIRKSIYIGETCEKRGFKLRGREVGKLTFAVSHIK